MSQDDPLHYDGGRRTSDSGLTGSELVQEIFEELNQILWVLRTDGSVRRFNTAWTTYTGLPAMIDGLSWAEVFHAEDRQRLLAVRTAGVAAGVPYEVEARMRRADGVYRRHLCRVKPLRRGGAIHAWLGTAIDVEDARASEERQRALVELSDWLRDLHDPKEMAWAGAAAVGQSLGLVRAGTPSLTAIRRPSNGTGWPRRSSAPLSGPTGSRNGAHTLSRSAATRR